MRATALCAAAAALAAGAWAAAAGVPVASVGGRVATVRNGLVRVAFDLKAGVYSLYDEATSAVAVRGAWADAEGVSSRDPGIGLIARDAGGFSDELGSGRKLTVESRRPGATNLLLEFRLYAGRPFVVIRGGLRNDGRQVVQLRRFQPMTGGAVCPGARKDDLRTLNSPSGATQTGVTRGPYCYSPNNVLVTFGGGGRRRSVVLGALKTADFPKWAGYAPEGGQPAMRRAALDKAWPDARLVAYMDCGDPSGRPWGQGVELTALQGTPFTWTAPSAAPIFASVLFDYGQVVVGAAGLDPTRRYVLGFSWWDLDSNQRVESVKVLGAGDEARTLIARRALPASRGRDQEPEELAAAVPQDSYRDGKLRVAFTNDGGISNAVVSEVWLWEADAAAAQPPEEWTKGRPARGAAADLPACAILEAADPVGKRLDPGASYMPDDSFYVDAVTADPFAALEQYGWQLRLANGARPNPYDFPTLCAWYAGVANTGGAQNNPGASKYRIATTPGLVEEADRINRTGFLRYSRVAGRIVPDNYTENSPQGWWDDRHWQQQGFYVAPYETSRKWGRAMQDRGCLAFTYFQVPLVSQDFRRAFPKLLIGDDVTRTLDFTKPAAIAHMRKVYAAMRGGISGMMFDYCDELWANIASTGGFEDRYCTAAAFYRTVFRLAKEGLGLVDSQRTSGDTYQIDPAMVARSGLRWYKSRVVLAYDMDSKEVFRGWKTPGFTGTDEDGRRAMLTMAYVAASRLLLANSFREMTPEVLHDLSRTFPYPREARSARPVDAFVSDGWPHVYDFAVTPKWHEVAIWNWAEPSREQALRVPLGGEAAGGALGLDPRREYYAYDFWNDRLAGRLSGREMLVQTLRSGEARVLAVHEVEPNPQVLSTNRHIMQGYLDLARYPVWDGRRRTLCGESRVVGGEAYRVVIALNGYRPVRASRGCVVKALPGGQVAALTITRPRNENVPWEVTFAR
jgi:hypothetical protein